jgi:hypothetical protein
MNQVYIIYGQRQIMTRFIVLLYLSLYGYVQLQNQIKFYHGILQKLQHDLRVGKYS